MLCVSLWSLAQCRNNGHSAAPNGTLALNQQADEARTWLKRLCKVVTADQCEKARTLWVKQSLRYPEIAAIAWPIAEND